MEAIEGHVTRYLILAINSPRWTWNFALVATRSI